MGQGTFEVKFNYVVCLQILQRAVIMSTKCIELTRIKSAYYSDYINKSVRVTQGNKWRTTFQSDYKKYKLV
jgi:hypothetical protein